MVVDPFCGEGGAAMGLHLAWSKARIVGVDINPQPGYPFEFIQADALTFSLRRLRFRMGQPHLPVSFEDQSHSPGEGIG
jgi:hypothetical protein